MSESTMSKRKDSEQSKVSEEGQIQPIEIEPRALTNAQLQLMIDRWGVVERIGERFASWGFHFSLEKVVSVAPETFFKAAIHYVVLKKMQVLIRDFDQNDLLMKSMQLKDIYQLLSLKGKLKGQRFDYLLIVTVKLISFFLGSHIKEIIIRSQLQSKIYAILVFVLLGTQVGEKAYFVIIEKHKRKMPSKSNQSQQKTKDLILPTIAQSKKIYEHHNKTSKTTAHPPRNTANRIQYRYGTQLMNNNHLGGIEEGKYREMKQLLRVNLKVREFIPKPKVKQSLDAVLGRVVDVGTKLGELDVAKGLQSKEMKHKKIGYAQMSSSMDLKGDNHALSILQNHSLNIKPQKLARFYQMKKKQDIMLQSSKSTPHLHLPKLQQPPPPPLPQQPQAYSYQAMVVKKKQPTYWKKILCQMKQNHYEDIQHLPPVNMRMHFKQWQLEDQNKRQTPAEGDDDDDIVEEHHQVREVGNSYHGEYITQRVVDLLSATVNAVHSDPHSNSSSNIGSQQQALANKVVVGSKHQLMGHKKGMLSGKIITDDIKQQPRGQQNITVTEYSGIGNDGEMFKAERGFLHIYSSKPINDFDAKIRKKTYAEIKQLERKFYRDKKIRQEKILQSQFS